MNRCRICGDLKPLDADGVCRWRDGCEHRVEQHDAEMRRLNRQLANNDPVCRCGGEHADNATLTVDGVQMSTPTFEITFGFIIDGDDTGDE